MKKLTILLAFALMLAFVAQSAMAVTSDWTITNNSGASQDTLRILFSDPNNAATLTVTTDPAGCGASTVTKTAAGTWEIVWPSLCVDNAETLDIEIVDGSVYNAPTFTSGQWLPGGQALGTGDVNMNSVVIPTLSTWGLVLLALVLVGAGVLVVRRKRSLQGA